MNSVTSGALSSCASRRRARAPSSVARMRASSAMVALVAMRRMLPVTSTPRRFALRIESSAKFHGTSVTLIVTGTRATDESTTKLMPYCSVM
jgi:hypothetical protein